MIKKLKFSLEEHLDITDKINELVDAYNKLETTPKKELIERIMLVEDIMLGLVGRVTRLEKRLEDWTIEATEALTKDEENN